MVDDAVLWLKDDRQAQMTKLLQISSSFPKYFEEMLKKRYSSLRLDEIANKNNYEPKEKRYCKKNSGNQEEMEFTSINLMDQTSSALLGTCFTISKALSANFVERLLNNRTKKLSL